MIDGKTIGLYIFSICTMCKNATNKIQNVRKYIYEKNVPVLTTDVLRARDK